MILLSILKFLGFAIAAASTLWGLTTKTSVDDETGRRHLTAAGQVAIALSVGSFLVATVSTGFETMTKLEQDRKGEADRREQKDEQRVGKLERATDRAIAAVRERRLDQQRLTDVADARFRALEQRATATEQRSLILASADAERRRGDAQLRRDFALAGSVNRGSQQNLSRTGEALTQLERVLQPLGRPTVIVEWELNAEAPIAADAMADLIAFGDRVRSGDPIALDASGFKEMTPENARRIQTFQLVPTNAVYPSQARNPLLNRVIRAQGFISLFAGGRPFDEVMAATFAEQASGGSPLYRNGDLRFGLQGGRDLITYNIDRHALWFEARLRDQQRIYATGAIVSVPDLDRAILALNIGAGSRGLSGEAERIRQLLLLARPRSVTIAAAGRIWRIPASRFQRVATTAGDPIFVVAAIGPPTP